jgi:hypothetical protein
MPKFKVTETQQIIGTRTWEYEVEANNQEEALVRVMEGNVKPESYDSNLEEGELGYEVEEVK